MLLFFSTGSKNPLVDEYGEGFESETRQNPSRGGNRNQTRASEARQGERVSLPGLQGSGQSSRAGEQSLQVARENPATATARGGHHRARHFAEDRSRKVEQTQSASRRHALGSNPA